MTLQDILNSGRAKLAKAKAEEFVRERQRQAEEEARRASKWQALLAFIRMHVPECLLQYSNVALGADSRPDLLAGEEDNGRNWTSHTSDFELHIEPPGCAVVSRKYDYNTNGKSWHVMFLTQAENDWYVRPWYICRDKEGKASVAQDKQHFAGHFADLYHALAFAETVYQGRNDLLLKCEHLNAERLTRMEEYAAKQRTPPKTVEERLIDVLAEFVNSRLPEPQSNQR